MSKPIPIAILGVAGYAGEVALRILLGHPGFSVVHVGSDRLHGKPIGEVLPAFTGESELVLSPDTVEALRASGAVGVLLAKKSPEVTRVVPALLSAGLRMVDIGAEFRLRSLSDYRSWYGDDHACAELLGEAVYGLSEIHGGAIATARVVGNPGCFATSVLLPLIPLLRAGVIDPTQALVSVSYSGLSGAGKRLVESNNNLFYAINENLHSYKAAGHQHSGEIDQELSLAAGKPVHCSFIPHLAPITRGIHSTITATLVAGAELARVFALWRAAFTGRAFVRVRATPKEVEVAHTSMTNYIDLSATVDGRTLIITSALDNLVKGASGQAVQNLNLMFGLPETAGLLHRSL
jgi:N-acetyl-gamma-glutamyl-phosphate reductase